MGYVFDFNNAVEYDQWFNKDGNQRIIDAENRLLVEMLHPRFGERLLDIGCGAGASLMPFLGKGIQLTGVDPSPYMLDIAKKKVGNRVDLHRAYAEDLPFEDNSFDYATFCLSLEFTEDPVKALEEACRVAKDRVIIGVLNRYAPLNMARQAKSFFFPNIYSQARFFSIWELKMMLSSILGRVPVKWRTTLQFPFVKGRWVSWVENRRLVQRSCFGTFIGMQIKPVPKFRTRPLSLKIPSMALAYPSSQFESVLSGSLVSTFLRILDSMES